MSCIDYSFTIGTKKKKSVRRKYCFFFVKRKKITAYPEFGLKIMSRRTVGNDV